MIKLLWYSHLVKGTGTWQGQARSRPSLLVGFKRVSPAYTETGWVCVENWEPLSSRFLGQPPSDNLNKVPSNPSAWICVGTSAGKRDHEFLESVRRVSRRNVQLPYGTNVPLVSPAWCQRGCPCPRYGRDQKGTHVSESRARRLPDHTILSARRAFGPQIILGALRARWIKRFRENASGDPKISTYGAQGQSTALDSFPFRVPTKVGCGATRGLLIKWLFVSIESTSNTVPWLSMIQLECRNEGTPHN